MKCPQCSHTFVPPEEKPIPEGCTPADAMALREANHHFAEENHQLRHSGVGQSRNVSG
jgi:hypothetical protein